MNLGKAYVVFLTDDAAEVLGKSFSAFIRSKDGESFIFAKAIDSEGNYFHASVEQELTGEDKIELELQIPHEFVKGALCGEEKDIRQLGLS